MKSKQLGFTAFEIVVCVVALLGAGGWIANIVKFIGMLDGGVTAMFLARAVGIAFAPLGAVLGFF